MATLKLNEVGSSHEWYHLWILGWLDECRNKVVRVIGCEHCKAPTLKGGFGKESIDRRMRVYQTLEITCNSDYDRRSLLFEKYRYSCQVVAWTRPDFLSTPGENRAQIETRLYMRDVKLYTAVRLAATFLRLKDADSAIKPVEDALNARRWYKESLEDQLTWIQRSNVYHCISKISLAKRATTQQFIPFSRLS